MPAMTSSRSTRPTTSSSSGPFLNHHRAGRPMLDTILRLYLNLRSRSRKLRRTLFARPRCEPLERRDVPSTTVIADFNGDGYGDLAVGASGDTSSVGAVNVIYGSGAGLSAV